MFENTYALKSRRSRSGSWSAGIAPPAGACDSRAERVVDLPEDASTAVAPAAEQDHGERDDHADDAGAAADPQAARHPAAPAGALVDDVLVIR